MDTAYIINWLKNSVLGIIILGAIGSIVSIFIIRLFNFVILKLIPKGWKVYSHHRLKNVYKHGYILGYLKAEENTTGIIVYYFFHTTKILIYLLFWIFFFNLFLIFINFSSQLLTFSSYISILLSFLFLFWAIDEFNKIRFGYIQLINPIMDKAIKAYEKRKDEFVRGSSDSSK